MYTWGSRGPWLGPSGEGGPSPVKVPLNLEVDGKGFKIQAVYAGSKTTFLLTSEMQKSTPRVPQPIPIHQAPPAYPCFSFLQGNPSKYFTDGEAMTKVREFVTVGWAKTKFQNAGEIDEKAGGLNMYMNA
eukprot:259070-Amorphochlora_amoeboformis.AAC.1